MREQLGDAWELSSVPDSVLAITTNGYVKSNGAAVMGRGIAAEARHRYEGIEYKLGHLLREHGNHVWVLHADDPAIVSFPVKHHWAQMADPKLIERSALELVDAVDQMWPDRTIYVPRPGCGNGGLDWEMVRPLLEDIFDDRFVAVDKP